MNKQHQAINSFIEELTNDPHEIYHKLSMYGINSKQDIESFRNQLALYVYKATLFAGDNKIGFYSQYQDGKSSSFKHLNVTFDYSLVSGPRDNIKLYIPVEYNELLYEMAEPVKKLYDFLFENKINFESKISPRLRNDLFCIRLNNSDDALKVINFCKNVKGLHNEDSFVNPFLASEKGIGLARDTYHTSYNEHIGKYLYNFINGINLNNIEKDQYAEKFLEYIEKSVVLKSNDKFIKKVIIDNLKAIIDGKSFEDVLPKEIEVNFDAELYNKYRRKHDGKSYIYVDSNNVEVNENSNKELYLKLQANNFLSKLFYESYGDYPKEDFKLNSKTVREISNNLDYINDGHENYGLYSKELILNREDPKLAELLPYFYANFAHEHKECNLYRSMEILRLIKENTYHKQVSEGSIIYGTSKREPITTTYPLIKTELGTVGIQMIDSKLANIYQIKDGKIKVFENVVIQLEEEIMRNENNPHYQEYRTYVAQELLDYKRMVRMINDRSGHMGVFEYNKHKDTVDKFVPESEVLRQLKKLREQKLLEQVSIREEVLEDDLKTL